MMADLEREADKAEGVTGLEVGVDFGETVVVVFIAPAVTGAVVGGSVVDVVLVMKELADLADAEEIRDAEVAATLVAVALEDVAEVERAEGSCV